AQGPPPPRRLRSRISAWTYPPRPSPCRSGRPRCRSGAPSAKRAYRCKGQEDTFDDLEYHEQVGLPTTEVGCGFEYLSSDRKRECQRHSHEDPTGDADTVAP